MGVVASNVPLMWRTLKAISVTLSYDPSPDSLCAMFSVILVPSLFNKNCFSLFSFPLLETGLYSIISEDLGSMLYSFFAICFNDSRPWPAVTRVREEEKGKKSCGRLQSCGQWKDCRARMNQGMKQLEEAETMGGEKDDEKNNMMERNWPRKTKTEKCLKIHYHAMGDTAGK